MSERNVVRWSGVSVTLGGLALAAYMLIHPWAERTGAVATTPRWLVSHGFHFLGALFLLLGLTGLYLRQRERTGVPGLVGFLLAFLGTALFVGTGMTSTFLWPAIAAEAPTFVESGGAMFSHPLALGPILAARIFLVLGLVWLGVVSFRAGVLPRWGSLLVVVGVVATNLPTEPVGPVPWIVAVLGGVVLSVGLVGWGWALWTGVPDHEESPIEFVLARKLALGFGIAVPVLGVGAYASYGASIQACFDLVESGLREVAESRGERFLGKVGVPAARCRGGGGTVEARSTPWVDWRGYYGAGDANSRSATWLDALLPHRLERNGRGLDGALMDLEYQRLELIQLNLFDNTGTYPAYTLGRGADPGPSLQWWPAAMRLDSDHPNYADVGGDGEQLCGGELIRARTLIGICNDVRNPAMGSSGMPFARNVQFETTFPELEDPGTEDLPLRTMVRNRHGNRLDLLTPDPQVISRRLFTRRQDEPDRCNEGQGLPGRQAEARCDYTKAPFFNVLAAFWIQFMTHDWFSHLDEGENRPGAWMAVGCSDEDAEEVGCRPGDRIDAARIAEDGAPPTFEHDGETRLARAYRTTDNSVTAWWDASQIYGHDATSARRVKRDPSDPAKLLMVERPGGPGLADGLGYLPTLAPGDPMLPMWEGQEAVAFPDNFNIGLSFYHNVFAREHNAFVDHFRDSVRLVPDGDSGLRRPDAPHEVVTYAEVTDEELYQAARLVVAAEIAKIHTIEWTTQLLYNDPLYRAMNANWTGLFEEGSRMSRIAERIREGLAESRDPGKSNLLVSLFASGSGIVGMGSRLDDPDWSMADAEDVNRGVTHFGSPFNFPEEFITVYRLHPLVPDLIEYRSVEDPNAIRTRVPVVETVRQGATRAMRDGGLPDWALSMGRQRLGLLSLDNHPRFLQNLQVPRLRSETGRIDVAALDIIRDRERGVPRFNEFRRQYGLRSFRSFEELAGSEYAETLREIYGTHVCDSAKSITDALVDQEGNPITDCLGFPDGTEVDNIEDVDAVVGWLAEKPSERPHGFAISETQFQVFIINASRRLFSDRFFTSSFRPEFYSTLGYRWVMNNGPGEKRYEPGAPNGYENYEVSPFKRVLLRTVPELEGELEGVINAFDPWARDRGTFYCLDWKPRPGAEADPAFESWDSGTLACTEGS